MGQASNMDSTVAYSERVARDGYAIIPGILTAGEIETLRDAVATIPSSEAVRRKRSVHGVRNLLEVCPAVRELAASQSLRDLVTPILGHDCFAVRAIYFDKTPDANWSLGWHQDGVITVKRRIDVPGFTAWSAKAGVVQVRPPAEILVQMLAIRVHLDDCSASKGPLRVLPGSHRFGWQDDQIEQWKQSTTEIQCLVGAGGVVAVRPLLLHASSAATDPGHRRVVHIEYACQDLPGGLEWNWRVGGSDR